MFVGWRKCGALSHDKRFYIEAEWIFRMAMSQGWRKIFRILRETE